MSVSERILGLFGLERKRAFTSSPLTHAAYDGQAVYSDWSAEKAIREGLKASTWVYSSVNKVSTAIASVPLVLEKQKGEGWEPDPAHPLQALLNRPNPFMARQDMTERWAQHMQLAGNALWWVNVVQGVPRELWPIMPDTITPIASRREYISGYRWRLNGTEERIMKREEISHWQFADPSNPRWGLSPLQAAAGAVDLDVAANRWNRAVLNNDGKPPLAIFLSEQLAISQMREAAGLIRDQIDGNSIRKALVLGGATKVQPLSLNATELDFLNGRKFSRDEIAAVFGVPSMLLHAGEGVTYANLEAAKLILWEDRVVPLLDDYTSGLELALFPFFGLAGTHRIHADLSGVRALQANMKTEAEVGKLRAETFRTFVEAGVPANQAATAAEVPLVKIPGGDAPRQLPQLPQTKRLETKAADDEAAQVAARLVRMDAWSEEVRVRVSKLLLEQGKAVVAAYADGLGVAGALSLDDWRDLLSAVHTSVIEAEGKVAYSEVLRAITANGTGGTFDVLADGVTEWIEAHVGDSIQYIDETTKTLLRAEIAAGVEAGEGSAQISRRLRALHEDWATGPRAKLVAVTETGSAFNAAHQLNAEQMAAEFGVTLVKTWRSASDSRVRPEHRELNGETVPIDEPFSNGLMQPGEPRCRCVALYTEAEE